MKREETPEAPSLQERIDGCCRRSGHCRELAQRARARKDKDGADRYEHKAARWLRAAGRLKSERLRRS